MAGIYSPTGRRIEARQNLRLPQLHISAIDCTGWPQIVAVICLLMLVRHLVSDGLLTAADTVRGTTLDRSQAGLPARTVRRSGTPTCAPTLRRTGINGGRQHGRHLSTSGTTNRGSANRRLPQLRLAVHGQWDFAASPHIQPQFVARSSGRRMHCSAPRTPTVVVLGNEAKRAFWHGSQWLRRIPDTILLPRRSTSPKPTGDRDMAGSCATARRQIEAWQLADCPNFNFRSSTPSARHKSQQSFGFDVAQSPDPRRGLDANGHP